MADSNSTAGARPAECRPRLRNHELVRVDQVDPRKPLAHPIEAPGVALLDPHSPAAIVSHAPRYAYAGAGPALVVAGLVRAEWLPGSSGCPTATQYSVVVGDRKVAIRKRGGGRFVVAFGSTEAEMDADARVWGAAQMAEEALAVALADERRALAWLPNSRADFRGRMLNYLRDTVVVFDNLIRTFGAFGYRFDRQSLDALRDAIDDAHADFAAMSSVHVNPAVRAARIAALKAKTARADPAFAGFMSTIGIDLVAGGRS